MAVYSRTTIDVTDYGADPLGSGDSTTAFKNAIIDLKAGFAGGNIQNGKLYIPAGVYKITDELIIPFMTGFIIEGDSRGGTIIRQYTNDKPIFTFGVSLTHSWKICNLTLDYNTQQTTANTRGAHIYFDLTSGTADGFFNFEIDTVTMTKGYYGILLNPDIQLAAWGVSIRKCNFGSMGGGAVRIQPEPAVGQPIIKMEDCYVHGHGMAETAIMLAYCDTVLLDTVEFNEGDFTSSIMTISSCFNATLINCRAEQVTCIGTGANFFFWNFSNTQVKMIGCAITNITLTVGGNLYFINACDGAASLSVNGLVGDASFPNGGAGAICRSDNFLLCSDVKVSFGTLQRFATATDKPYPRIDVDTKVREYDVVAYGADPTGTNSSSTAFAAALAAMGTTEKRTLRIPTGTYKLSSTLTINPSYHSVKGDNAKIITTMTTGYLFDFVGSVYPPYGQNTTIFEGLRIQGAGETSALKCFKLASANTAGTSRISFRNITLYDFGEGVTFGNASYLQNFTDCEFYNLGRALYLPASTDAGERISFRGCTFYNSDSVLEAADGDGSMMFHQCSFDYNVKNMVLSGGFKAFMSQCHIEGDTSTAELFTTTGAGTSITATDCWFLSVTGTGTYAFFNAGASGNGALRIRNCFVNNLPTTRIAVGTGMVDIQGLNGYSTDKHYVPADRMSYLADPSFEGSNPLDPFTQTKTGTGTIAVDATTANTGTKSIKFTKPLTTDTCYMDIVVPIRHGQRIFMDYFHKYTSVVAGAGSDSWLMNVQYRDSSSTPVVLAFGEVPLTTTLASFTRATVTYFRDNPPPKGTTNVRIRFGLTGTSTGTAWLDDLTINVC